MSDAPAPTPPKPRRPANGHRVVFLEAVPRLYALYDEHSDPADRVVAWVLALPDGASVVLQFDHSGVQQVVAVADLESVSALLARRMGADLVSVVERRTANPVH